jgi:hypothetical protein
MVLPAHALQAVQVTLKSVNNEGHFTLEAETVFRLFIKNSYTTPRRWCYSAETFGVVYGHWIYGECAFSS